MTPHHGTVKIQRSQADLPLYAARGFTVPPRAATVSAKITSPEKETVRGVVRQPGHLSVVVGAARPYVQDGAEVPPVRASTIPRSARRSAGSTWSRMTLNKQRHRAGIPLRTGYRFLRRQIRTSQATYTHGILFH